MIRLFVLIGILGGAAVTYLATYGAAPEAQRPPAVSQLEKFRAAGLVPGANEVRENEEIEHDIFLVPPEDEEQLETALANAPSMPGMGAGGSDGGSKDSEMAMAEGGLLIAEDGAFDREIELTMTEWSFSEMRIDVKIGERIKFTVKNGGEIPHEFMFMTPPAMAAINYRALRADWSLLEHEALLEQSLVLPGGDFSFVVEVQQAGSWMFMCMLPYHMPLGMMGQMATEGMAMDM